jgi:hypothetical protein
LDSGLVNYKEKRGNKFEREMQGRESLVKQFLVKLSIKTTPTAINCRQLKREKRKKIIAADGQILLLTVPNAHTRNGMIQRGRMLNNDIHARIKWFELIKPQFAERRL